MSKTDENVRARLAQLEDRVENLRASQTATDDDGQEWSASQLVEMGLTRRQALFAIGTLAVYGGSIWAAIKHATGTAEAATDQVGLPNQRVDVFGDSVDANSVITDKFADTYVAPTPAESTDIGAEINDIHDNKASDGDAIFVPPGTYDQQTTIAITKDVMAFSTGDWLNPGAEFVKQADVVACDVDANGSWLKGIHFRQDNSVADNNAGVVIDGIAGASIFAENHGSHGIWMASEDGSANGATLQFKATRNRGDGVRLENLSGGVNLNAMQIEATVINNIGAGFYSRDAYSNELWLWTQANGTAFDIGDAANPWYCRVYAENNNSNGVFNGGTGQDDPDTKITVLNNRNDFTTPFRNIENMAVESGEIATFLETVFDSADVTKFIHLDAFHDSIAGSATKIADAGRGGFVIVYGEDQGSPGRRFIDLVTAMNDQQTVQFSEERATPDARTYSTSSEELSLSFGSGDTYNVSVFNVRLRAQ